MQRGLHRPRRDAPLERSLVGFRVGHVAYAVPTKAVRAIELPVEPAALPNLPRGVVGVYEYRGQILPVLDLRLCFETPLDSRRVRPKWIVLESGKGLVSLVVDEVSGVFVMGQTGLEPVPPLANEGKVYHFSGVAHQGKRATFVLDLSSFHSATLAVEHSARHSASPPSFRAREVSITPLTTQGAASSAAPQKQEFAPRGNLHNPSDPER